MESPIALKINSFKTLRMLFQSLGIMFDGEREWMHSFKLIYMPASALEFTQGKMVTYVLCSPPQLQTRKKNPISFRFLNKQNPYLDSLVLPSHRVSYTTIWKKNNLLGLCCLIPYTTLAFLNTNTHQVPQPARHIFFLIGVFVQSCLPNFSQVLIQNNWHSCKPTFFFTFFHLFYPKRRIFLPWRVPKIFWLRPEIRLPHHCYARV